MRRWEGWSLGGVVGVAGLMTFGAVCDVGAGRAWELRWNSTTSLPTGVYLCHKTTSQTSIARGALVAFAPTQAIQSELARVAPQLQVSLLMKQVAVVAPATVCLEGQDVRVDGLVIAQRPLLDSYRLTGQEGCHTLAAGELFVLGPNNPRSYDSRYFGPLAREAVTATCTAVWTWGTH